MEMVATKVKLVMRTLGFLVDDRDNLFDELLGHMLDVGTSLGRSDRVDKGNL